MSDSIKNAWTAYCVSIFAAIWLLLIIGRDDVGPYEKIDIAIFGVLLLQLFIALMWRLIFWFLQLAGTQDIKKEEEPRP